MNLSRLTDFVYKLAQHVLPRTAHMSAPSLKSLADQYESELCDRTITYTFTPKRGKKFKAPVVFERSNFCHLFSLGSIVKGTTPDEEQFAGMKGWKNVKNENVTFSLLKQMNPSEFAYYQKEYQMVPQFFETIKDPDAVRYDASRVSGSKLKADVMLYKVFGASTVHIAICQDDDGTWFPRSYFVRENNRDKQYPTKYIHGMDPLDVAVKVSSKNT